MSAAPVLAPPADSATGQSRWRDDIVSGGIVMGAVLAAFGIVYALSQGTSLPHQDLVLAVVLTLTLSRLMSRAHQSSVLVLVEVPLLGVAATLAGWLVLREPWVGQPLLVVALCVGVQSRRWDGVVRQAGRVVALPFLALLVTPVPRAGPDAPLSLRPVDLLWGAAVGLIAVSCALAGRTIRTRTDPSAEPLPTLPVRRRPGRLDAATRSAVQLLLALGSALALGHLLFGQHWPWAVISAYIVLSSARGRGDVVHKAGLRVVGAALGTAVATSATVHGLPAGNRWLIVAVFVVMAVALVLRNRSYAWWAAGVTAMIALIDGYYGSPAARALPDRVLGVLLGSALGVVVAWFVLPVHTRDVLRRYLADCLAALTDDLDPESDGLPRTPGALRVLREVAPAWKAHRSSVGRRNEVHPMDAVAALHRLAELPADERERRRLRRDVVRVRRAIVGRDDPSPDELPPDLATVHAVLQWTQLR